MVVDPKRDRLYICAVAPAPAARPGGRRRVRAYAPETASANVPLLFLINFAALLSIDVWLAWMSVISFPIVFLFSTFIFKKICFK